MALSTEAEGERRGGDKIHSSQASAPAYNAPPIEGPTNPPIRAMAEDGLLGVDWQDTTAGAGSGGTGAAEDGVGWPQKHPKAGE